MNWASILSGLLVSAAYLTVPAVLWRYRQQIAAPMWPPALMTVGVAALWGIWYLVLITSGSVPEFHIGFTRALHFPAAGLLHYLILFVYRRPAAILRRNEHPEPTDVP